MHSSGNTHIFQTIAALLVASALLGLSANFYMMADIGSDSITVFEDGIHQALHIRLGVASYVYSLTMLALALIMGRKYIGWTTIAYSLFCGPSIDLFGKILMRLQQITGNAAVKAILVALAVVTAAASFALLMIYQSGMNSIDAAATGIAEKTGIKYRIIRTSMDVILMLSGWLLGGTVGWGTIPAVFLTGTLIDVFVRQMKKVLPIRRQ